MYVRTYTLSVLQLYNTPNAVYWSRNTQKKICFFNIDYDSTGILYRYYYYIRICLLYFTSSFESMFIIIL